MTREELTELLDDNGYEISDEQRLPDGTGWQFRLASGQIISLLDDGSWNVEGSDPAPVEALLREYQTGTQ
ncbi:MAG: hypothetical protein M1389_03835 [Chloroflexi bacterium]|nr:hypothetical protein [Chloroflexota bacterium]